MHTDDFKIFRTAYHFRVRIHRLIHSISDLRRLTHYYFSQMPGIILMNLCKYCDDAKFRISALNTIKRIITKDINENDTKIQLALLVHMSKIKLPVDKLPNLYLSIDQMTTEVEITHRLIMWQDVALKVMEHTEVSFSENFNCPS